MDIKPPPGTHLQPVTGTAPVTPPASIAQSNTAQTALPPDWKVSQLIDALITKITDKQLFMTIQGTATHTAKPAIPNIQAGDSLKLQITQLNPLPQFKIIEVKKAFNTNLLIQTLKSLAQQQPTSIPLLKNLAFVATRPSLRPAPLAVPVNAAIRELFRKIPSTLNLKTATQVKTHIENSGIFTEGKLKNQIIASAFQGSLKRNENIKPVQNFSSDLRVQLIRLAELIRNQSTMMSTASTRPVQISPSISPPNPQMPVQQNNPQNSGGRAVAANIAETQASLQNMTLREEGMHTVLRQIESSLNQIQHTQLQSLNDSQTGRPVWLFELPVKDGQDIDLFKFRISQDDTSDAGRDVIKIWSVTLEFNFEGLGLVKSQIKLHNNLVSALFFSEQPQTLYLFNEHFDYLRSRLNSKGLNVGSIESKQGKLHTEQIILQSKRLDERT